MVDPDVITYLRQNINKFPVDDLRQQLLEEGVSDVDFEEALKVALRAPAPKAQGGPSRKGLALLAAGLFAALLIALALVKSPPAPEPAPSSSDESAFIGRQGYVIRLPRDYVAVAGFKDSLKTVEIVHFCKAGTDPTNFLNEGLYAQLGIVRLEVRPDAGAGSLQGLDALSRQAAAAAQQRGEKYRVKNLQLSALKGFELTVESPFPRLETYILGRKVRYTFTAGQDDEIYRDLLTSLRETQAEAEN